MFVIYFFIAITFLITLLSFNDSSLLNKLLLYPRIMTKPAEYYRLLTSGFIHADYNHLIFNMITLYFFGRSVESVLIQIDLPSLVVFPILYLSAIIISSIPAMLKHKNDVHYRALGASGGVSAVVFFSVYYYPWSKIYIFFIPIGIPAIIYGVLYSLYSLYMSKKGNDNIGHDAHLGGAFYGFIFALLCDPTHGALFISQILHPQF